jgi:Domain of unknown function (DUF5916)
MKRYTIYITTFILVLFSITISTGQNADTLKRKSTVALRTQNDVRIDGILNESDWNLAPIASDFTNLEPVARVKSNDKTEVRIMYDDKAIYVAAIMYEAHPDSIAKELTSRDDVGNSDWFIVTFDTYKSGQNGVGFLVQASNVQSDVKYYVSENGDEDSGWNAVWKSNVSIGKDRWIVEMEIPYSALRFPEKNIQDWRVNFGRLVRRTRAKSFWSEVNPTGPPFVAQFGDLEGIQNIKPPVRLSATPFLTTYHDRYNDKNNPGDNESRTFINGGLDVKYGINDAYTLDMTVVPDFGQARSDNKVLNLSPFEVQFDEQRQFFTEGIEMFNKGNLLYSRRIGGRPLNYNNVKGNLQSNEKIISNPTTQRLYNVSKISGRNNNGLGLGVLNAVAAPTDAIIENENGQRRTFQTAPLTNYNILSMDKQLKNNSYMTLVNTSVLRQGSTYDANVTGGFFDIKNKKNSYSIGGRTAFSQLYFTDSTDIGHQAGINVSKISGDFQFGTGYYEESHNYNPRDLGFLRSPNEKSFNAWAWYGIFKPFAIFNSANFNMNFNYNRLYKPDKFNSIEINGNAFFKMKSFDVFGFNFGINPATSYDYFEPRTKDFSKFLRYNPSFNANFFFSSNYARKFALDFGGYIYDFKDNDQNGWGCWAGPRYRFNDKFALSFNTNVELNNSDRGFVGKLNNDIIIGVRDRTDVTNLIDIKYTFNSKIGTTFRLRHYWSRVKYLEYNALNNSGTLEKSSYSENKNETYDAFNIDMVTTWRFAPGSDLIAVWKQNIEGSTGNIDNTYFNKINKIYDNPITNSFSIKMIYFLDYLDFVKKSKDLKATRK